MKSSETHGRMVTEGDGRTDELLAGEKNSPAPKPEKGARATKARRENKKFVNVLVDKDIAMEAQVRMQFRGKSWDALIQELLTKWVYETPERPYR